MSSVTQLKRTLLDVQRNLKAEREQHTRTLARLASIEGRFPGHCQLCGATSRGPLCAAHSDLAGDGRMTSEGFDLLISERSIGA